MTNLDGSGLGIFSLAGKAALVTGGGGGLGGEMAAALATAGADVALLDLSSTTMARTEERIRQLGHRCLCIQGNVTSLDDIQRMVKTTVGEFGHLDIAVNSAGINIRKPALEYTEADWCAIMDVNLRGLYFCCLEEGRVMVAQGKGRIINISSLNSEIGLPLRSIYAASKGGVTAMSRTLAAEWAKNGVTVNCIGPGHMLTPLTERFFTTTPAGEVIRARIPMGRLGQPADLAGTVIFLASDASAYITGQTIYVDGGYLLNAC